MQIENSIAVVTGAGRGLGAHLVEQLLAGGAAKVYAGVRDTGSVTATWLGDPRVEIVALDVTDQASADAAAAAAQDATLLINNAGTLAFGDALTSDLADYRRDLDVNFFGTITATRAFAPALVRNAPGAIVNVVTIIAMAPARGMVGYSASKAAGHAFTQAVRAELDGTGVDVLGAYPAQIDTDMLAGVDAEKTAPAVVAERIVDGIRTGSAMIYPDDSSAYLGSIYASAPAQLEAIISANGK